MKIKTDKDITGPVARDIRTKIGMPQHAFWGAVGVRQAIASRYEAGLRVPPAVRSLIFIRYVAGIPFDTSTEVGAGGYRQLAAHVPHN